MKNDTDYSKTFAENVFSNKVMQERLPKATYEELLRVIAGEEELSLSAANVIADEMKNWAVEKGATHYCHWFQPLTGITAEKHDAFISRPDKDGNVILKLSGKNLIKGESDASSFPSGGLRATFEARGYTAWDCTSPAFVREDAAGVTLYIPTAFCSYTGESLDKKTPLLKSMEAVNTEALKLLRLLGNTTSKKVIASVGAEQEYFIVDRKKYLAREDLVFAGRTLFGANPPKGQDMDDHYMGTIPERVGAYMKDVNEELWKLGVPAKTAHNESAPAQHELAPIFEEANIATDHNQLIMETLKKVAGRHGLMCLLHEKPFRGVNGSGKHNNWSLNTDDGINLFDPGENPHGNLQFLLMLTSMMRAVDRYGALLQASASDVGNDERLGGNEAPPAIMSMFLGTQLTDILDQIIASGEAKSSISGGRLHTPVSALPDFEKDATDRNRTSPFAFTGNKFEFRSVGSMDSIAEPNVVLNTIAAESFKDAAERLTEAKGQGVDIETAVRSLIREYATEHKRIVFNGNNYSEAWVEEAKKRDLPSVKNMVDATEVLLSGDTQSIFGAFGIYSRSELESRAAIRFDRYSKAREIEANAMLDMVSKSVIPAVIDALSSMAVSAKQVKDICPAADISVQTTLIERASFYLNAVYNAVSELKTVSEEAKETIGQKERAVCYRDRVLPVMENLRRFVDALEMLIDKKHWPMPSYADLMYEI